MNLLFHNDFDRCHYSADTYRSVMRLEIMNALALQEVQTAVAACEPVAVKQRVPTQEELSVARASLKLTKHPRKVSSRLKADIRAAVNSDVDWGDC